MPRAMRSWHTARVGRRSTVDEGLVLVDLEVPGAVSSAFARPGQFNRIRLGGAESMFAIASSPGSSRFEYLIRRGTGVSDGLATLDPGAVVEVSPPEGPGFPLGRAEGHDLLLVCTGTALAPIRSVLGLVAARRQAFNKVTLLEGHRSPRQLPWREELMRLPSVDVRTIVTEGAPGWNGPVGFVQSLVSAAATADTVAFLVGQPEMTKEVTALLGARAVPGERIFLNV